MSDRWGGCRIIIADVNRQGCQDSKNELDGILIVRDHCSMIAQRYCLYIERKEAAANLARFYALSIEPSLFGEVCFIRRWGRIGTRGRSLTHPCATEREAVALFLDHLRRKRQRGYRILGATSAKQACANGAQTSA